MGDWLTGLVQGFQGRKGVIEQENLQRAQLAAAREAKIYEALLDSPDPQVRSLAATGLLQTGQPAARKGGLAGYLGELEQSPIFPTLLQYAQTPQTRTREVEEAGPWGMAGTPEGLPAREPILPSLPAIQPMVPTPPGAQPAAQAPTAVTSTTAGPPTPVQYRALPTPPGTEQAVPPPTRTETTTALPRMFPTGEDKAQGAIQGKIAGFIETYRMYTGQEPPPELVKQLILELAGANTMGGLYGRGGGFQSIAGEIVNPDGSTVPAWGVFDRAAGVYKDPETGQPLDNFRPRTTTGSRSMGTDREALARAYYGRPYASLTQIEQQDVINRETGLIREQAREAKMGDYEALSVKPFSPQELLTTTMNFQENWDKVSLAARGTQEALGKMEEGYVQYLSGNKAAGSEALVVTWQKVLDSLSVVREAEYLRPGQNQSFENRVRGILARLIEGGTNIPPEELGTYIEVARGLNAVMQSNLAPYRERIVNTIKANPQLKIDPATIFGPSTLGLPPTYSPEGRVETLAPTPPPAPTATAPVTPPTSAVTGTPPPTSATGAAPTAATSASLPGPPPAPWQATDFKVGETIEDKKGQKYKVMSVNPDGTPNVKPLAMPAHRRP